MSFQILGGLFSNDTKKIKIDNGPEINISSNRNIEISAADHDLKITIDNEKTCSVSKEGNFSFFDILPEGEELEKIKKELESKTRELESKTREIESKTRELEEKTKEIEKKTNELETTRNELEKRVEAELKLKDLKEKIKKSQKQQEFDEQINFSEDELHAEVQRLATNNFDFGVDENQHLSNLCMLPLVSCAPHNVIQKSRSLSPQKTRIHKRK